VPGAQVLQVWQVEALFVELNDPAAQGAHPLSAVTEPERWTKFPGLHTVFATQTVAGSSSSSHLSPVQGTGVLFPPAQYSPALHAVHTGAELDVPDAVCTLPAGHWSTRLQIDWFAPVVTVPVLHGAQARSVASLGKFDT
jgi:hypothetical protein